MCYCCSYQACRCGRCGRSFEAKGQYLDLTLTSGVAQQVYEQKMWQGTELFRWGAAAVSSSGGRLRQGCWQLG